MANDEIAALNLRSPSAYGRAFVDVYDQWYHDVSDAEAASRFIASRCGHGPGQTLPGRPIVVEFGVGTGRLGGPMTSDGLDVIGIDASMPMLHGYVESDQPQACALVAADMRALPFRLQPHSRIAAAVIAFNTLFNVVDDANGQQRVLSEARTLVAENGVVIIEALTVDDLPDEPIQSIGVRTVSQTGVTVSATQIRTDQTMTGQHLEISDSGLRIRPWILRWLTPSQLDELASSVGLALVERFSTWDERPFLPSSTTHISVYRAG